MKSHRLTHKFVILLLSTPLLLAQERLTPAQTEKALESMSFT